MNKAIFLDRDGVLNYDFGYVYKKKDFKIIEGVIDSLKFLQEKKFLLIIITNQSGIGRGYYSKEDFCALNNFMLNIFEKEAIKIHDVIFCPHLPEANCTCRKPATGMIDFAVSKYNINKKKSYLIGDKDSDIVAGRNSGLYKCFKIQGNGTDISKQGKTETYQDLKEIVKRWKKIK